MILHHTLLHKTGASARLLIRAFDAEFSKDIQRFVPWLFDTQQIRSDPPGEDTFDLGPEDAITGNWDHEGRNYTLTLYEDPDGVEQPFVTLIENRRTETSQQV